jgi:pimeloyl-ACP methyl ester carboxylesterase
MHQGPMRVQGAKVAMLERGEGPPILLLHGNPDSSALWGAVIERLAPRFRCLAPDLPGFGGSPAPKASDFSLTAMAAWVDAVVTAADVVEPVILAVHDIGAAYGLPWACRHPERIRALAISNTIFSSEYRWHFWGRIWRTPLLGELSMLLLRFPIFRMEMRRGARQLSDEHVRRVYDAIRPEGRRTVLRLYRALSPAVFAGWEDQLRALTARVPSTVVWGVHDPYIPARFADSFGVPPERIRRFDRSGHWLPAELPGETAAAIEALVA